MEERRAKWRALWRPASLRAKQARPLRPEANAQCGLPPVSLGPICVAPSADILRRPPLSAVVVTHLVTHPGSGRWSLTTPPDTHGQGSSATMIGRLKPLQLQPGQTTEIGAGHTGTSVVRWSRRVSLLDPLLRRAWPATCVTRMARSARKTRIWRLQVPAAGDCPNLSRLLNPLAA
jgi:hypothetical protein